VTLKNWLGVTQGHQNVHGSILCLWLPINNYVPISYRFRDRRQFQSKIVLKNSHAVYFVPRWRGSLWIWVPALRTRKLEWWAIEPRKKFDDIFSRMDTIYLCYS